MSPDRRIPLGPLAAIVSLSGLWACNGGSPPEVDDLDRSIASAAASDSDTVSRNIPATAGGTLVHPAGARLTIPPGSLPADAMVSLRDAGPVDVGADPALHPLSHHFVVSLQGVRSCRSATLSIETHGNGGGPRGAPPERDGLVLGATTSDGEKLYRAEVTPGTATGSFVTSIDLCGRATVVPGAIMLTFSAHASVVHSVELAGLPTILHVPYYWQDNLTWCMPTSLAMVMNQFDDLAGIVSNYELAGADGQGPQDFNKYTALLGSMGVAASVYSGKNWDVDLISSTPFYNYVKTVLSGTYPQYTRGLAMSSTTTSHGFVGVGANNDYIWLHDPSGAFVPGPAAIAVKLTWAEFNAIAVDPNSTGDVKTLYINKPLRPAEQLTGSIVLDPGAGGSWTYETDAGVAISHWIWDGAISPYGYYWDDPQNNLPIYPFYSHRFPRSGTPSHLPGRFAYDFRVANVTGTERSYQVYIFLENQLGTVLDSKLVDVSAPRYTWDTGVTGVLDNFNIVADGEYQLKVELWEAGNWLDVKRVGFQVGDGPLAIP